jgi:hypothetical protein
VIPTPSKRRRRVPNGETEFLTLQAAIALGTLSLTRRSSGRIHAIRYPLRAECHFKGSRVIPLISNLNVLPGSPDLQGGLMKPCDRGQFRPLGG